MHKNSVRTTSLYWLLFCALITAIVASLNLRSTEAEDNINMLKELSRYRSVIEESINRYFTLVLALEAFVHTHYEQYKDGEENDLFKEKFNRFTESLERENPSILSLQLAPKGIVTFVTREDENRKAIGHDLLKDDNRRDQVIRTIINRSTVVAGPVTLVQGGNAIIGRKAIFTHSGAFKAESAFKDGRAKEGDTWPSEIPSNFWGFATMLVDTDRLFKEFGLHELPVGYEFALRGKHGLGAKGEIFWGNPAVFDSPDYTDTILLPGGSWMMGIKKTQTTNHLNFFGFIGAGFVISILGIVVIYSRNQKVQAEAEAKTHSRFLATMSHEIRTPMNGIIGVAEVLKKTELSESQLEKLDVILSNSKVLLRLVNDILDFSKIDSGKMQLEQIPYNPRQTLVNSFQVIASLSKAKGLPVHISISDDFPNAVRGDEVRLQQILVNLLSNALKFTEKGQVNLSAMIISEELKTYMAFTVQDTGIGMSENELKRIFNPFTQADQSITRKFGGTGLGLVICEKLVSLMKGEIDVESELGVGSSFTIKLPLLLAPEIVKATKAPELNNSARVEARPLAILIVDDQQMNLNVASMLLQQLGHSCTTALSAREALSLMENTAFDMIYMDRHMPEMDGLAATRKIREISNSNTKPWIVALTASAQEDEKQEYLEAGANDFMSKPVDFDHFESTIAHYLAQKSEA